MSASSASVHPVEETPATDVGDVAPIVSMKNIEGMPGTRGGLALRCFQLGFAAAAFGVMAASSDFASVSAFSYLVAAAGDGITTTLTFAAACACAGITVLIDNDLDLCSVNKCVQLQSATAMAFLCWLTTLPSFFFNFWSLASR